MKIIIKIKSYYFFIITVFLFAAAGSAQAANWYVRPSGGSGSGTSWTAAWNGFNAINWGSVACGDTIWVAGGTYAQDLNPAKKCTSGSKLNIRRARSDATECTFSTGWTSSYDSNVFQSKAGINIGGDYDYIVVSGRTSASGGNLGWHINYKGATSGAGIEFYNGADGDGITFEYINLEGPGQVTYSGDGRGIDATPFSDASDNTFSHMKIWDWESGVYNVGINNSTFEYVEMYDIMALNWSSYHPNGIYISGAVGGTVRYSKFYKNKYPVGEGIFFEQAGGASDWRIYGNIFYDINETGAKAIEITSVVPNLKIWNNTFDNIGSLIYDQASPGTGSEFRNNLIYNSGSGWSWGTTSNNLVTSNSAIFVNRSARDYRITSSTGSGYPRNSGYNLASYFTNDADGTTFGADGAWDIGAYEYASSTCTPSCSGKVCGDNGCGGSCGTCTTGQSCVNGACVSSTKPGDANNDGKVDIFDFNIIVQNFGSIVCSNPADFDKNCKVNIFDYNILLNNFGK